MGRNEWFRPSAGLREYIAQEIAGAVPTATPVQAAYFRLQGTSIHGSLPSDPKLSDLLAVLNYQAGYTTPDEYWGEDVSAAQIPLAVPAYGTGNDDAGYGPIFPAGPDLYYIEFQFSADLVTPAAAANVERVFVGGNINGNVYGSSFINEGGGQLYASVVEVFSVLSDGGDAQNPTGGDTVNPLLVDDQCAGWCMIIKLPGGSGPRGVPGPVSPGAFPIAVTEGTTILPGQHNVVTDADDVNEVISPADETILFQQKMAGDAFPRVTWMTDITDGIYLSDGTFDAWNDSGVVVQIQQNEDGPVPLTFVILAFGSENHRFSTADYDSYTGTANMRGQGLFLAADANSGVRISSGDHQDPNAQVPGEINDFYVLSRSAGNPVVPVLLWRCTTAGDASSAVWAPYRAFPVPNIASSGGWGFGMHGIDYEGVPVAIDGTDQTVQFDSYYDDLSDSSGHTVPLTGPVSSDDFAFQWDVTGVTPAFGDTAWVYMVLKLDGTGYACSASAVSRLRSRSRRGDPGRVRSGRDRGTGAHFPHLWHAVADQRHG